MADKPTSAGVSYIGPTRRSPRRSPHSPTRMAETPVVSGPSSGGNRYELRARSDKTMTTWVPDSCSHPQDTLTRAVALPAGGILSSPAHEGRSASANAGDTFGPVTCGRETSTPLVSGPVPSSSTHAAEVPVPGHAPTLAQPSPAADASQIHPTLAVTTVPAATVDAQTSTAQVSVSNTGTLTPAVGVPILASVVEDDSPPAKEVGSLILRPTTVRVGRDHAVRRFWDEMNATGRSRNVRPGMAQGSRDALLLARAPVILCPRDGSLVDLRCALTAAYAAKRSHLEPGDGCSFCSRSPQPSRRDSVQLSLAHRLLDHSRLLCSRPTTVPPESLTLRTTEEAYAAAAATIGMVTAREAQITAAILSRTPTSGPYPSKPTLNIGLTHLQLCP
jgi:hypothetical protein